MMVKKTSLVIVFVGSMKYIGDVTQLIPALPPNMESYEAIFIPVNDGKPNVAYSGTHWSLMVYVRAVNSFFYYDTLKFNNLRDGEYASKRFQPLLQLKEPSKFIPSSTPQQENGSDCGGNKYYFILCIQLTLPSSAYYIYYRLYFTPIIKE